MLPYSDSSASLSEVVSFLISRRESILKNWYTTCVQDPKLDKVAILNQNEFNASLPVVLNILQQRILGQFEEGNMAQIAIAHGLQRRYKARLILETVRELNHLTQALYNELSRFQELFPHTNPKLLWQVQQHITQIMSELTDGCIQTYDELQRSEAAKRAAILQKALDQVTTLAHDRNAMFRSSMHDLRGGLGIINGAASLLNMEGLSEQDRTSYLSLLNRNLASVQVMLTNLMDLSRLEAGGETLQIEPVDAAQLLKEIAMSVQPLAEEQGLVVRAEGADSLAVETDVIKLQRIIQNILLNALKYTSIGFVQISWAKQDAGQWIFSIQDSGPGLPAPVVGLLTGHIQPDADLFNEVESKRSSVLSGTTNGRVADVALGQSVREPARGEGIGLKIVKQFSELLRARLEVETVQGQGTSFSLWLPTRYQV